MTENYCIIEEITAGQASYFKCLPHSLSYLNYEFFINDLIGKPKSLKSKYIKFHYFPSSEMNVNIHLYIIKEILNDNNIIDLEPVANSSSRNVMSLEIKSSFLQNETLSIVLDRYNYDVLKSILTEERFSKLALEVELQGGII